MTAATTIVKNSPNVFDIPLLKIVADPKRNYRTMQDPQALEELKESMKRQRQLQTVEVVELPNGTFELILGFRRFAAAQALGWETIRAEVVTDGEGKPLDEKNRRIRNAAENMAREDLTPYDQAYMFKDLKVQFDMSAKLIGDHTGKSVSYINNLTRVLESLDDAIIRRWKLESQPGFGWDKETGKRIPNVRQVCTMNWLTELCRVPKVDQEHQLKVALGLIEDDDEDDDEDEDGSGRDPRPAGAPKRATMPDMTKALEAAEAKKKDATNQAEREKMSGVIDALKFCIGKNQSIKGVYTKPKQSDSKDDEN